MKMFDKWNWEDTWLSLLALAAVAAIVVASMVALSPKVVDGYYLSQGSSEKHTAACVWAHWTWHVDEIAFCSDDYQRVLDFAAKANATVRH